MRFQAPIVAVVATVLVVYSSLASADQQKPKTKAAPPKPVNVSYTEDSGKERLLVKGLLKPFGFVNPCNGANPPTWCAKHELRAD